MLHPRNAPSAAVLANMHLCCCGDQPWNMPKVTHYNACAKLLFCYSCYSPCAPVLLPLQAHPVLRAELDRVGAGIKMELLDTVRYRLDEPPLNRRNDVAAWRAALDNAHSQLEHQYNRWQPFRSVLLLYWSARHGGVT